MFFAMIVTRDICIERRRVRQSRRVVLLVPTGKQCILKDADGAVNVNFARHAVISRNKNTVRYADLRRSCEHIEDDRWHMLEVLFFELE